MADNEQMEDDGEWHPHDIQTVESPPIGSGTPVETARRATADPDYRARWQEAEARLREFTLHYSVPPEKQRRKLRDLCRQYGIASKTIADLRGENARLREELARAGQPAASDAVADAVRSWLRDFAYAPDDVVLGSRGLEDAQLVDLHSLLDRVDPGWREVFSGT